MGILSNVIIASLAGKGGDFSVVGYPKPRDAPFIITYPNSIRLCLGGIYPIVDIENEHIINNIKNTVSIDYGLTYICDEEVNILLKLAY